MIISSYHFPHPAPSYLSQCVLLNFLSTVQVFDNPLGPICVAYMCVGVRYSLKLSTIFQWGQHQKKND